MSDVYVGRGRVSAEFDAKRFSGFRGIFQLFPQIFFADAVNRAFFQM
jgi:hypothetical protein